MKIAIIGKGRLGRSLFTLLTADHEVRLYGRSQSPTEPLVLLAVPDACIAEVARSLRVGPVVLHCSGARSLEELSPHLRRGRFHPLMTFPGDRVPDLRGVAVAISGDDEVLRCATELANTLGLTPVVLSGDARLYHAAAVVAGNLTALLLSLGGQIMAASGVASQEESMRLLLPLVIASAENAARSPQGALTGPAARGDHTTIAAHREALSEAGLHEIERFYGVANQLLCELVAQNTQAERRD